jgi:hypothetical protein
MEGVHFLTAKLKIQLWYSEKISIEFSDRLYQVNTLNVPSMAVQVILEKSLSELHKEAKKLESQPG